MKKNYKIAEEFINKEKANLSENYYIIRITLGKKNFEQRFEKVSHFTKAFMNGKQKLSEELGSNRDFFNRLKPYTGFYKVFDFLTHYELVFYIQTTCTINSTELKYRLRKLMPCCIVSFFANNDELFVQAKECILYDTSLELIGQAKKSLKKHD